MPGTFFCGGKAYREPSGTQPIVRIESDDTSNLTVVFLEDLPALLPDLPSAPRPRRRPPEDRGNRKRQEQVFRKAFRDARRSLRSNAKSVNGRKNVRGRRVRKNG